MHEHPRLHRHRFDHDAAPQPAAPAALPVDDAAPVGMPIVFLLLFVYVFGGQLSHGLGSRARRRAHRARRLPQLRHARHPADDRRRRRPGHRDRGRDGHDRRHHRPVPHDGRSPAPPCSPATCSPASSRRSSASPSSSASRSHSASAPPPDPLDWLAAIGVLALFAFALIWLATALGLAAKSVETASNTPMFLTLLPFLGSGFVLARHAADRAPPVRPVPAVHPGHRDPPRPPHRNPDRQQRHRRRSPGASASPSSPISGRGTSTQTAGRSDVSSQIAA